MNIVKLDSKTWRIEDGFVYFYLLAGTQKALMIDSGVTPNDAFKLASELTSLPVILANTHGDGDHMAGNKSFGEFYLNHEDYNRRQTKENFADCKWHDLTEGMVFDLGERDIEVIEIPGHTYGSVAFLDVTNRVLYSGDTVSDAIIYLFGEHRNTAAFKDSLIKLANMENRYDVIYPAHGTPVVGKNHAQKVLEDWEGVMNGTLEWTPETLFGNKVRTYHGANCGFYLAD